MLLNRRWRGLRRSIGNCKSSSGIGVPGGDDKEQSELISDDIVVLSIRF
jgi:hypothetical protein